MPEMRFDVKWPDGTLESCYSPSLIIRELLTEGTEYPVFEFLERTRAALNIASERVKLKHGFYCSAAMDQLAQLGDRATKFDSTATVTVVRFQT